MSHKCPNCGDLKTTGECGTCGYDPRFHDDSDGELAFDGGRVNTLKATEKLGFRVKTDLTTERRANEIHDALVEIGVDPERIEVVSERIGVDPA